MRGVFITSLLDIEDSALVIIIHRVGVLVKPRLIGVYWRGWSITLKRKEFKLIFSRDTEKF